MIKKVIIIGGVILTAGLVYYYIKKKKSNVTIAGTLSNTTNSNLLNTNSNLPATTPNNTNATSQQSNLTNLVISPSQPTQPSQIQCASCSDKEIQRFTAATINGIPPEIQTVINQIKSNSSWYQSVQQKATQYGRPLDTQLILDAYYTYYGN